MPSYLHRTQAVAYLVGPVVDRLKLTRPRLAYVGTIHIFSAFTVMSLAGMVLALVNTTGSAEYSGNSLAGPRASFIVCAVVAGNFVSIVQPLANNAALACVAGRHQDQHTDDENLVRPKTQASTPKCQKKSFHLSEHLKAQCFMANTTFSCKR